MADQELGLRLKTDSDVPEAMGKAKSAVVSFEKQLQDITKKFSTSFKDIFLSFAAPVVLLNKGLDLILNFWENQKRLEQEATQAAIDGINERMAKEDIYWARKQANAKKEQDDINANKTQIEKRTREFITTDPRGFEMLSEQDKARIRGGGPIGRFGPIADIARNPAYQEAVRRMLESDIEKSGMLAKPGEGPKATTFQGPAGVNAVVGMGNNAAMQAQLDMLEEQRKQTMLLEQIAQSGGNLPSDFTKSTTAAPSRSYLLTK